MSDPRTARANLSFNGKSVTTTLEDFLLSVEYTDIADGGSDEISIEVQDIDLRWMNGWAPKKGDTISGSFEYSNWNKDGDHYSLQCGEFVLDQIKFNGGPRTLKMNAVSVPASGSFKTRNRSKTWKKVTIRKIVRQIASRYKLSYRYDAGSIKIAKLEQSEKTDCAFLSELCSKYGLGMKIFRNRLIVYDKGRYEKKAAVATLHPEDFVDEDWEYESDIEGTYTGCRITYKNSNGKKKKKKGVSTFVGSKGENDGKSRTMKMNQQCGSVKEARQVATAAVNKSNEQADVLNGEIFANVNICAATCVDLEGFGEFDGHYFIDKSKTSIDSGGAKQQLEMHKAQQRVSASGKKKKKKKSTKKSRRS